MIKFCKSYEGVSEGTNLVKKSFSPVILIYLESIADV